MKHLKSCTGKGNRKRDRGMSSARLKQVTVLLILLGISISMGCIAPETKRGMTIEEAMAIAQNSECVQEGRLTDTYVHNEYTRTWWIDLDPFTPKEGCNPACVVNEDTKTAEINWRCTGLMP